jgi:transcriptional regulator with XRE-family HTH domain
MLSDDLPEPRRARDPVTVRLLDLLYQRRKARGWTVRDLAQRAGISPSYVSLIENGHKVPDAATIERLGEALDIDPDLLRAWVTVRSKTPDATESVRAAYELTERLGLLDSEEREANFADSGIVAEMRMAFGAAPEQPLFADLPTSERHVMGIPLLDEGTEPDGAEPAGEREMAWIDRRALPERHLLAGAFAWRLSSAGKMRLSGDYRSGDIVVIAPSAWEPTVESFNPKRVFAVRHEGRLLLTRLAWTGTQLVLQSGGGPEPVIVIENTPESRLARHIAGRVVAAVVRFR